VVADGGDGEGRREARRRTARPGDKPQRQLRQAPRPVEDAPRRVVILGSTGSIGRQALDVVAAVPDLLVVGLAVNGDVDGVLAQADASGADLVALGDAQAAARARRQAPAGVRVLGGTEGVLQLIDQAADEAQAAGEPLIVLNGIVGAAGLRATMATLHAGATLALANKESLVAGGELVIAAAAASGAVILPVDSEHSALFQCILAGRPPVAAAEPGAAVPHVTAAVAQGQMWAARSAATKPAAPGDQLLQPAAARLLDAEELLLTGSGGPFRGHSREQLASVTRDDALRHPTWSMGAKITIDSATLMNKGLEVIEAHYLFGVPYERIRVLIHPQSIVHSLVRFADGAVLGHLGVPDMRVPIGYALTYPRRAPLPMVSQLDLAGRSLTFMEPDLDAFGCLRLAREAGVAGGSAPVVLNAANEVAVHAFLNGSLDFLGIEAVVADTLETLGVASVLSIDDVLTADAEARRHAAQAARRRSAS
jgi:1-deoxy-D-xylulose-5-phosphate reductoisomerase